MDNTSVIETLRSDFGISDTTYSDDQLIRFIDKSVKKISEYYPFVELGQGETVAEQTRYQVTHTDLIKIRKVNTEQLQNIQPNTDYLLPEIPVNGATVSSTGLSSGFAMLQTIELYRKLYPCDATVVAHDMFEIIPTPEQSGLKIIYEYERYRAIEEIPNMFEEDLIDLVMFYIGDKKYKSESFTGSSNTYWFDRRGNIRERSEGEKRTLVEMRKVVWNDILDNIKRKVKLI